MEENLNNIQDETVYNNIVTKHDIYTNIIDQALLVVKEFIISRKLILVGGMAIDLALRKKGSKIYDDDVMPDYDFLSSNFHKDAYDLGNILAKDFPNISVIGARHPSTMRVRVNFISVADITYVPLEIYNILPTINHGKLVIISPTFQYIDQHRALSNPYENPPQETILSRWEKDIKRYDLLYNLYPLSSCKDNSAPNMDFKSKTHYNFKTDLLIGQCIGGYTAIVFWFQLATKLGMYSLDDLNQSKDDSSKTWLESISEDSVISETKIDIKLPNFWKFTILSDNLWDLIKVLSKESKHYITEKEHKKEPKKEPKIGGKSKKRGKKEPSEDCASFETQSPTRISNNNYLETGWYNAILDKALRCVRIPEFEIFDNNGNLTSAYKPWDTIDVWILNLQNIMQYLLVLYFWVPKYQDFWVVLYNICRQIVTWASKMYLDTSDPIYIKFLPNSETYGNHNWSDIYLISRSEFKIKIQELPKPDITTASKPKNAYPTDKASVKPDLYNFDPKMSPIYQFNGLSTKPFTPTILPI